MKEDLENIKKSTTKSIQNILQEQKEIKKNQDEMKEDLENIKKKLNTIKEIVNDEKATQDKRRMMILVQK